MNRYLSILVLLSVLGFFASSCLFIVDQRQFALVFALGEIKKVEKDIKEGANPRDAKIDLAMELTTRFTNEIEAEKAKDNFFKKFSSNELPSDIEEKEISYENIPGLPNLLKDLGMVGSTSEAMRLIEQGAVKIDQEKVTSKDEEVNFETKKLIQIGKKKFLYVSSK